tara:strand:- start:705 stop:851 length:147 start_codon:yes stop_codon:yes gene_type:complete
MKYHGGWGFLEAYNLPTIIRMWFVKRLQKQFEMEKEAHEEASSKAKRR